ncbi:MAG: hypothetical protein GTO08_11415, partial [Deltaproteobacteria bacterium]|nr:hypothetical protein [Deltaproteobacteria bacterium]
MVKHLGVDLPDLKQAVESEIEKFPKVLGPSPVGQLYITQDLKNVLDRA